jgi:tetratricopeptide (TPR) repeat protein
MDIWTIIVGLGVIVGILAGIAGIPAGITQLLDYLQRRQREKVDEPSEEGQLSPLPSVSQVLNNLPSQGEFIGRVAEKLQIHEVLASGVPVVTIEGVPGIGKTALALAVAHEVASITGNRRIHLRTTGFRSVPRYDSIVWMSARYRDLDLTDILDTVARVLELTDIIRLSVDEKRGELNRRLQRRRTLLIIDNFESVMNDADIQEFLEHLSPPTQVLITSRYQVQLSESQLIPLCQLSPDEGIQLIRQEGNRLKIEGLLHASDEKLLELCKLVGGSPLVIKWTAGQMRQTGQILEGVMEDIADARGKIFEFLFDRSWNLLSEESRKILKTMPVFEAPASRTAIKAACDLSESELEKGIKQLVQLWLVEPYGSKSPLARYSIHPLTRAYAEAKLRGDPQLEQDTHTRVVRYFCGYTKEHRKDIGDNFDRLEEDLPNILAAFDYGCRLKNWERVVELLEAISGFLDRRGYWHERVRLSESAMVAARKLKNHEAQSWIAIYHRGWTLLLQEEYEEAKQLIEEGLDIAREHNYPVQIALAMRHLGVIALEEEQYPEARRLCEDSLTWWAKAEPRRQQEGPKLVPTRGVAMTQGTLGNIAWELKEYDKAYDHYLTQRTAYLELEDSHGLSVAAANLAICGVRLGRPQEAAQFCHTALAAFRRTGRIDGPGYMWWVLLQRRAQRQWSYPLARRLLIDNSVTFEQYGRNWRGICMFLRLYASVQQARQRLGQLWAKLLTRRKR